ncbi:DDE superfamily endonuclease [Phytophthora infestans]|uniref:DDE superfamily endonuclease n=1 Tax=Phytophthora infestans TaxID=4787 RepID=A0A8S9V9R9_PHYIN|nr:DDE superfamily endonuclease [Phytophthora infestans]
MQMGPSDFRCTLLGKSEVPRPLKGRDVFAEIGATYTNTSKAWMNTTKYCEWLKQLNESMVDQQRHVLLLVDNVSSHSDETSRLTLPTTQRSPTRPF